MTDTFLGSGCQKDCVRLTIGAHDETRSQSPAEAPTAGSATAGQGPVTSRSCPGTGRQSPVGQPMGQHPESGRPGGPQGQAVGASGAVWQGPTARTGPHPQTGCRGGRFSD